MFEPLTLPSTARWTIPPVGDLSGLRVTVSYPARGTSSKIPALILLDGDTMFLTATEFVRTVNLVTAGEFPQVAIVGVMRDEPHHMSYVSSRFRDFTPQPWVLPGPFAEDNAITTMGTGGAHNLLESLEREVLPQVRQCLDSVGHTMGEVAIGGWSLSGLFACWAWLERPDLFAHLLAISPSLWWNDAGLLDSPFATRPEGQRAFVCVGENEEGDVTKVYPQRFANAPQRELAAMVTNAATFARMVAEAGATVESLALPDEHHVTVQAVAISRGLRHLYAERGVSRT